jgi:hypothetical protein
MSCDLGLNRDLNLSQLFLVEEALFRYNIDLEKASLYYTIWYLH